MSSLPTLPWSRRLLGVGIAGALLWAAAPAHAQQKPPGEEVYEEAGPTNEARERFKSGLALTKAGQVDKALVEFQAAFDLSPNWKILYNIGQCSRHVKDHVRALRAFERYLAEGGAAIAKPRRAEVEKEIAELKGLVGTVDLVAPEGAEIAVDGAPQGKAPLPTPLLANAGRRKVTATRPGAPPITREIDVPGGGSVKLELAAGTEPPPTGDKPNLGPRPAADTGGSDNSTWIRVGMVATGVFVLGAAATGTIALVSSSDLESSTYAGPYSTPPPDLQSQASTIDTLAVLTDVLIGAAIVGAGVTVYLIVTDDPPKEGAPKVGLQLGPGSLSLKGAF